jgi:hypothetical protein
MVHFSSVDDICITLVTLKQSDQQDINGEPLAVSSEFPGGSHSSHRGTFLWRPGKVSSR